MGKAAGAVVAVFMVGSGAMTLLSAVLGTYAEAAALSLVGLGLFATSSALAGKLPAPTGVAKEA